MAAFSFKLAPTYALYMMARYRASTHFRVDLRPQERANKLTLTLSKVANLIQDVIQVKIKYYLKGKSFLKWLIIAPLHGSIV